MCLAQGHNTVTPVRLEPAAHRSRVKHSTTEPLCSRRTAVIMPYSVNVYAYFNILSTYLFCIWGKGGDNICALVASLSKTRNS